jgi:hypothetical protein
VVKIVLFTYASSTYEKDRNSEEELYGWVRATQLYIAGYLGRQQLKNMNYLDEKAMDVEFLL